jgi:hypothetical protein
LVGGEDWLACGLQVCAQHELLFMILADNMCQMALSLGASTLEHNLQLLCQVITDV